MLRKGKKISVIGAGNVGASIAFALTLDGMASEIVIVDVKKEKARGEAMDIFQGTPFTKYVNVYAGDYSDTKDSDIVVLTAGIGRKPGQSRIELAQTNVQITKELVPELMKYTPEAVFIVVANPVDILTYAVGKFSDLPGSRILGSGTLLDSSRLRTSIGQTLGVSGEDVEAYVLGEHGDSSMVPWSLVTIAGMPVKEYIRSVKPELGENYEDLFAEIMEYVRTSGGQIIKDKGATFYAIAMTVRQLCETIIRDSGMIQPVSTLLTGQLGASDVCISLPCIIGAGGVERILEYPMSEAERTQFLHSAETMKEIIKTLNI
jgi:L-lactate dehydrogenase